MRAVWGLVLAALGGAAIFAPTSDAAIRAPSGDTCAATGTGTAYTLTLTVGANSPAQGGFAFGASGGTVTGVNIAGVSGGTASTSNLPSNTNTALLLTGGAVPGASIAVSVTTSGPIAKSFIVVPFDQVNNAWFDPVPCAISGGTSAPSNRFSVQNGCARAGGANSWSCFVTLPGPGHVSVDQRAATTLLITGSRVGASRAGKVKLTLRPTAAGRSALGKSGTLKVKLTFEFSPTNGKPGNKLVTVTLRN